MSISRAVGQKSQPANALEATWEGPRGGKASYKTSKTENVYGRMLPVAASPKKGGGGARARAHAPPPLHGECPLRVPDSFYISIYLHLLIFPSI